MEELDYIENPSISFEGFTFCFTGRFDGIDRVVFNRYVKARGARVQANVDATTDYLVIGSGGLRCCSFACCERVVEKAQELLRDGAKLQLIREMDFLPFYTP